MSERDLCCPKCDGRFIGQVPEGYATKWQGAVDAVPLGYALTACIYVQCRGCNKWQRYEIKPPNEIRLRLMEAA